MLFQCCLRFFWWRSCSASQKHYESGAHAVPGQNLFILKYMAGTDAHHDDCSVGAAASVDDDHVSGYLVVFFQRCLSFSLVALLHNPLTQLGEQCSCSAWSGCARKCVRHHLVSTYRSWRASAGAIL